MTMIKGILSVFTMIATAILTAVLTVICFKLANRYFPEQSTPEVQIISRESVISKVQSLSRLQTVSYNVDTVITSETQGKWYTLWQDGQKGLFVAHGRVQAGIDLAALTADQVQICESGKNITITLPAAQIFESYLDHIEVYDLQTGLLGKVDVNRKTFHEVQSRGKQQVRASACRSGILQLAAENAQKQVQALFALAEMSVTVHIQPAKACV